MNDDIRQNLKFDTWKDLNQLASSCHSILNRQNKKLWVSGADPNTTVGFRLACPKAAIGLNAYSGEFRIPQTVHLQVLFILKFPFLSISWHDMCKILGARQSDFKPRPPERYSFRRPNQVREMTHHRVGWLLDQCDCASHKGQNHKEHQSGCDPWRCIRRWLMTTVLLADRHAIFKKWSSSEFQAIDNSLWHFG